MYQILRAIHAAESKRIQPELI
ncbi:hypothetical protein AAEU31_18260 [Pseudoalteromonas sp. SSMSWG5]